MAPLTDLPEKVVEETFVSGLKPWIQAEMDFCESKGLAHMMKMAQKIENREDIRREENLPGYSGGKTTNPQNNTKANTNSKAGEIKGVQVGQ